VDGSGRTSGELTTSSHEDTKKAEFAELATLARDVVNCGFQVHKEIGPGLLESAYEQIMAVHSKQVQTYLRLMSLPLGLLMNFGQAMFKDGLRRIANEYTGAIPKR
jgi:hypothetical protein